MMKFGIAVVVAVLALFGAPAANAQVQPPQDRINTALARARQVGIPVALLESKIAEGKAKGVSLDRIAIAIERRQAALERARQALGGATEATTSLGVGADAIESGVSEAVLKAVSENAPRDRRNVAIAALTELVKQGHAPEAALGRVRDALKRGPDALSNLPAEAAAGRRGGGPPEGQGRGNAGGRAGGEPGPPAGVPAPGKPPQAGRPEGAGGGGSNRPTDPGRSGGGGAPTNPGRGGR
jgi:hypothetical protein